MNTTARILHETSPQDLASGRAATRLRRAGIILIAVAAAMADWFISARLIGVDLVVNQGYGDQPIQPVLVAAAPILSGLFGWLLLTILERAVPRHAAVSWRIIAAVVLAGSLLSPVTMAQSLPTMITLLSMHLLVGAILIIGLPVSGGTEEAPAR